MVETLDGMFELNETHGFPLIVYIHLPQDARLRYMWSPENEETIANFLEDSPDDVDFLFMSYGRKLLWS